MLYYKGQRICTAYYNGQRLFIVDGREVTIYTLAKLGELSLSQIGYTLSELDGRTIYTLAKLGELSLSQIGYTLSELDGN